MASNVKVNQAKQLAKTAPVLAVDCPIEFFGAATVLPAQIPSSRLGIVNTAHGMQMPTWLDQIMHGKASHQIIIDGIDLIDRESQLKFYELLKYKMISGVELPRDCTIIVLAKDLTNVEETILRQCLVVK